jgi:hypothetical protein
MKIRTILLILVLLESACSRPLVDGAPNLQTLVGGFINALCDQNHEVLRRYLVRKAEYVEIIHPETPEAKGVGGSEFWNLMIIKKRDILTNALLDKFKGKKCQTTISGDAASVEKHGSIKFYRELPVKIVCEDGKNLLIDENKKIFGIVVEKNGIFKILNIFGR